MRSCMSHSSHSNLSVLFSPVGTFCPGPTTPPHFFIFSLEFSHHHFSSKLATHWKSPPPILLHCLLILFAPCFPALPLLFLFPGLYSFLLFQFSLHPSSYFLYFLVIYALHPTSPIAFPHHFQSHSTGFSFPSLLLFFLHLSITYPL